MLKNLYVEMKESGPLGGHQSETLYMLHHQNTSTLHLCNFNGHPKNYTDIKSTHKQQFMKLLPYMYNLGTDI